MKEIQSLTVSKELVERLRTLMCCSGSQESCRDDGFCGSEPQSWPVIPNGTIKTRMTYPEDEAKPSIPDVPGFCDAYIQWYTQSNCGALAKEIAQGLAVGGRCPVDADVRDFTERILKSVPRRNRTDVEMLLRQQYASVVEPAQQQCLAYEGRIHALEQTLAERCEILYDKDADNIMRFNEDRAEALGDIAGFCQQVQIDDGGGITWKKIGGGGAAVGGVGLAIFSLKKLIGLLRGVKEIDESTAGAARGIRRFFSYSLPSLGRAITYALSFGWLRGKKPPPELKDPTEPKAASAAAAPERADLETVEIVTPHADVVLEQFRSLVESTTMATEGRRFVGLPESAQRYLATAIIDKWNRETEEKRRFFIKDDSRLVFGKIPIGYLRQYARQYLKPEMLPIIRTAAEKWAQTGEITAKLPADASPVLKIRPTVDGVYRQLIHDSSYDSVGTAAQEYLARQAIARWEDLTAEAKASFHPEETPAEDALPKHFIRFFRKRMIPNQKGAEPRKAVLFRFEQHAVVFLQILNGIPELAGAPFSILDRRTTLLVKAWMDLPEAVRKAFELQDGATRLPRNPKELPASFIQHLRPALEVGVLPRDTLLPTSEPWEPEDSAPFPYLEFDLRMVMSALVHRDEQAAFYPTQLGKRARSIVEAWVALAPAIRTRFMEQALAGEFPPPQLIRATWIPESYISLWYMVSPGIGITSRDPDADHEATPATARAVMGREGTDDDGNSSTPQGGATGGGTPQGSPSAQGLSAKSSFSSVEVATPPLSDETADEQPMAQDQVEGIVAGAETLVGGEPLSAEMIVPPVPPIGTTTAMTK